MNEETLKKAKAIEQALIKYHGLLKDIRNNRHIDKDNPITINLRDNASTNYFHNILIPAEIVSNYHQIFIDLQANIEKKIDLLTKEFHSL